jgi:arylsulfatase
MFKSRLSLRLAAGLLGFCAVGLVAGSNAAPPRATGSPNVLVWMLDDVGFAQVGAFAGAVETPNIDRLAQRGLRYSNYHTAAICSASRAAILTGRNPHSVHVGGHAAANLPYPGYDAKVPAEAGTIAANLHAAGYATYALGKWDHLPPAEITPAGPFNRWPIQQGFDHFYGFLSADADNWRPLLMKDNTPAPTPDKPDYLLNDDLADQAIAMIQSRSAVNPQRPFFMYFATGTAHSPHHAPQRWVDHYRGKFDMGWDKLREIILKRQIAQKLVPESTILAPRPPGMPAWDSLNSDQKKLYSRQMEVFAAALSHADEQFGRILDALQRDGELDNTLVIVTSDNGASAEGAENGTHNEALFVNGNRTTVAENLAFLDKWGGPETYPHYSFGWAVAGNTPFRYYKQTTHEGGTRVPLIVSWPRGIPAQGELRKQFVHVADIAPTILELTGVPLAKTINNVTQSPMEGTSFAYSLNDAKAKDRKTAQYFEMYGNKALWADNWSIVTSHRLQTWELNASKPANEPWELYDLRNDPGQTRDLAAQYPEKVAALDKLFDAQAKQYNVYPISSMGDVQKYQAEQSRLEFEQHQGRWVYQGAVGHVHDMAAAPVTLRPFRFTADLNLPNGRETGPVYALGARLGGMAIYLKDGVPIFIFRDFTGNATTVAGSRALRKGAGKLEVDLERTPVRPLTPQDVAITIRSDGEVLASRTIHIAMPWTFSVSETFDIGIDYGSTVSEDYPASTPFPGTIGQVVFDFNPR